MSTDDAVLQLTTNITTYLANNEKVIGVFLDLQKAFDAVSIPILLKRLENMGIRGNKLLVPGLPI
ncbi:reverse transcriptase [Operophtera brumata]|uniref:Reverse transcriptase n=1 Tax=Operophtera brumata TaxID=104452 RepID=A0A0L7LEI0_OPEBR|nr:reverse transcriptase [Operophtera brumata]